MLIVHEKLDIKQIRCLCGRQGVFWNYSVTLEYSAVSKRWVWVYFLGIFYRSQILGSMKILEHSLSLILSSHSSGTLTRWMLELLTQISCLLTSLSYFPPLSLCTKFLVVLSYPNFKLLMMFFNCSNLLVSSYVES